MQRRVWAALERLAALAPRAQRRRGQPRRPHQGGRRLRAWACRSTSSSAPVVATCSVSAIVLTGAAPRSCCASTRPARSPSWSRRDPTVFDAPRPRDGRHARRRSASGSSSSRRARAGVSSSSSARRSSSPLSPVARAVALAELERPGHLPDDLALEPEYEADLVAGEITVAIDEAAARLEVTIEASEDDDELELTPEPGVGRRAGHRDHPAGRGRPAAVPAVRRAARPAGPRLPEHERPPARRSARRGPSRRASPCWRPARSRSTAACSTRPTRRSS